MKIGKALGALMIAGLILIGSAEAGRYDRVKEIAIQVLAEAEYPDFVRSGQVPYDLRRVIEKRISQKALRNIDRQYQMLFDAEGCIVRWTEYQQDVKKIVLENVSANPADASSNLN